MKFRLILCIKTHKNVKSSLSLSVLICQNERTTYAIAVSHHDVVVFQIGIAVAGAAVLDFKEIVGRASKCLRLRALIEIRKILKEVGIISG